MNIQEKFYRDFIMMLNKHDVQFILVGGFAVALHGYARYTNDIDIWVNPTQQNMKKVLSAISDFGYDTNLFTNHIFSDNDSPIKLNDGPLKIDVIHHLTKVVSFEEAYEKSKKIGYDEFHFNLLDYYHLEQIKLAAGRQQDLLDVSKLREARELLTGKKEQSLFWPQLKSLLKSIFKK